MLLQDLPWPQVEKLPRDLPVLIPVAANEQHGHHLPVFTDSYLLGEVVRRAGERLGDQVLIAPLQWLGNSHHHLDFQGTLSADPRLYLDLLNGLADQFIGYGFRRILFLNGHGGNITPGEQAVFELRQRYRSRRDLLLVFSTYWFLADPAAFSGFSQNRMGHACEWETSMILRIRPDLVGPVDGLLSIPFGQGFEPAYRGWITKDRSEPGHIGEPSLATAEKGERLFEIFSEGVVRFVNRAIDWDGSSWDG